jgi:myosin-crossreactive antigen
MTEDDSCNFQTGEHLDDCYFSTSYIQINKNGKMVDLLGDFTNASSNITLTNELPIRIALKSRFRVLDYDKKIEMSSSTPATDLP